MILIAEQVQVLASLEDTEGRTIEQIARDTGRDFQGAYRILNRLKMFECVSYSGRNRWSLTPYGQRSLAKHRDAEGSRQESLL